MKLFGLTLGKEKAVPFPQFRDMVRLAVRRGAANVSVENTETGFVLTIDGKKQACNLRNLYADYCKAPDKRETLISRWINSLTMEIPEHGWLEAAITLRPTLKNAEYVALAQRQMQRAETPDNLPYAPFVGELSVIVMRDLPGTAVAVTQAQLDAWGVTFEEAMRTGINNLNMAMFPNVTNSFLAGAGSRKGEKEEVGLVFEGDHLTATWLIIERFRDYVNQRLQGEFVATVPIRSRLVAIRADEPGLISQVLQANRNYSSQGHALTTQAFHVSGGVTGGLVSVYMPGGLTGETLDANSMFARGNAATLPSGGIQPTVASSQPASPGGFSRQKPVDLSAWGGLTESTGTDSPPAPHDRGRR